MRITRIDLDGFGCLSDYHLELAPGLNLFVGENEAGKSTLQQAVCALLYGFYEGDRRRLDESERHSRYVPWSGARYAGSLEYVLANGSRFEVRRDFGSEDVQTQLIDLVTGRDVAAEFGLGRHGNVPFARRQLGMSRTVFQGCAFISQGEVFAVAESAPRQIGDAIAALADSARREVSVTRALERLDALHQKIGGDRARTAELPKARARLEQAHAELRRIEAARSSVASQAAELEAAERDLQALEEEIAGTGNRLARVQARDIAGILRQLQEAREELAAARITEERLRVYADFPAQQRDHVAALQGRLETARGLLDTARSRLAEASVPEDELLEFEALRSSVGQLTQSQLAELEALAYRAPDAGGVLAAVWRALLRALKAVARRVAVVAGRRRREAGIGGAAAVTAEEARELLERHRRYLELRPGVEDLRRSERQFREAAAALDALEAQVAGVMAAAGIAGRSGDAFATFFERCEQHDRQRAAAEAIREIERRIEILLAGRSEAQLVAQLEECQHQLRQIRDPQHAGSGAAGETADMLVQRLDELRRAHRDAELHAARLRQEVETALNGFRSRAEVEEDLRHAEARVRELESARRAVALAREVLGQAMTEVYRDFAPAVSAFLSEGIEYITGGRYRRAQVDPSNLQISMLVPETGRQMTEPPVSRGTRTVAYVLMRIGLAQHMSGIGEPPPLVLDDPFVDVDARRLERALDFVYRLGDRHQLLFFTKDEAVREWFRERSDEARDRLHLLSRDVLTAALL